MERWKTEQTETLLDTPWVKVRRDRVVLPNGVKMDDFYAITIRDASAIVALDEGGNLILKREYRYCYDRELLEIPAGAFNDGETDPLVVAKRELLEETGYSSDHWEYLGPEGCIAASGRNRGADGGADAHGKGGGDGDDQ